MQWGHLGPRVDRLLAANGVDGEPVHHPPVSFSGKVAAVRGPVVVGYGVAGDPERPGVQPVGGRERVDVALHPHEDVLDDVLGVLGVPDAARHEPVQPRPELAPAGFLDGGLGHGYVLASKRTISGTRRRRQLRRRSKRPFLPDRSRSPAPLGSSTT